MNKLNLKGKNINIINIEKQAKHLNGDVYIFCRWGGCAILFYLFTLAL